MNSIVKFQPQINHVYAWDGLLLTQHLADKSVDCICTSPPYYGARDYKVEGQIGREETPWEYVEALVGLFREARRVLSDRGTIFINLGDTYNGSGSRSANSGGTKWRTSKGAFVNKNDVPQTFDYLPEKSLMGMPWRVAFALQEDGWILRSDIIWAKGNPMPESIDDRPTKSHEYIFMFSKSSRYYYDKDAIAEPAIWSGHVNKLGTKSMSRGQAAGANVKPSGNANNLIYVTGGTRNKRTVWHVNTQPSDLPHYAMFPEEIPRTIILAGCPKGGLVFDPFMGTGTTGLVAHKLGRNYIGAEINPEYAELARWRIAGHVKQYMAMKSGLPYNKPMFEMEGVGA